MSPSTKGLLGSVLLLVLLLTPLGGIAVAHQTIWSRPGDPVSSLADADRAIHWWRGGELNSATVNPRTLQAANDRLWLATGQIVDDLMGLDIRTRSQYMRSVSSQVGTELEVSGLRVFCDPGDFAVAGGWAIDDADFTTPQVVISGSFPAPVALGPVRAWDVVFIRIASDRAVEVHAYATCLSRS